MSMPIIVPSSTTRIQALTDIIESIALEQAALSHILNAEGEKIQKVLSIPAIDSAKLLCLNQSVKEMVDSITRLEMMLQMKLELAQRDQCLSK